jgi:hypothetical protein
LNRKKGETMNADEARKKTLENKYVTIDESLDSTFKEIERCANLGADLTMWHGLDYSQVQRLKMLGYVVEKQDEKEDYDALFHISW